MKLEDHYFFPRNLMYNYPLAVKGEGVWIWDEKGKKYLDGCSGANVTGIGHGVREIADAMAKQAREIAYVPPRSFLNKPSLELSEMLVKLSPKGFNRVMLLSGGSEAMDNAFKIARQYHILKGNDSKYRIISRWQGFHGNTLAADAVGGHTGRRTIYTPMLMNVAHIVPACCYRCAFEKSYPDCNILCARDLERVVIQEGPEYISTFVCETIVGAAAGAVTPVPEYYPLIRGICNKYDLLWISDEIMNGVGRTGTFTAIEQWNVLPDLIVLAKGLSSGYAPLAAILINDKVFEAFNENKTQYIGGHTYNAHPVTSKVGIAVLEYIKKHHLIDDVKAKGNLLGKNLKLIESRNSIIGNVRGRGLMWGMEFVEDKKLKKPFDPELNVTNIVIETALERGLVVYPVVGCANGKEGDGILICPPLVISTEEIELLCKILEEVLLEVRERLGD